MSNSNVIKFPGRDLGNIEDVANSIEKVLDKHGLPAEIKHKVMSRMKDFLKENADKFEINFQVTLPYAVDPGAQEAIELGLKQLKEDIEVQLHELTNTMVLHILILEIKLCLAEAGK